MSKLISKHPPSLDRITDRQKEILRAAASGEFVHQTAKRMWVSTHTVKWHRALAMYNLQCNTIQEAVAKALRQGIIA